MQFPINTDSTCFDAFDKIYCINLPESTDRWEAVVPEISKLGDINRVEVVYAPAPPKELFLPNMRKSGQFGCTMSHIKAIGNALKDANGHVLILEDDIIVTETGVETLKATLKAIGDDWDLLYVGGQPVETVEPTEWPRVFNVSDMRGSYGYAINQRALLSLFEHIIDGMMFCKNDVQGIYDYILGQFSKRHTSYGMYPAVLLPSPAESIIQGGWRNYRDLISRRWNEHIPN